MNLFCFCRLLTVGVLSATLLSGCAEEAADVSENKTERRAPEKAVPDTKKTKKGSLGKKRLAALPARDPAKRSFDKITPKLLSMLAQNAIDRNDLAALSDMAIRALNSEDAKKRAILVESLGWFGEKALPDLVLFINDEDPDVQKAALQLVDTHFEGAGNVFTKINLIEVALPYMPDEMIDTFVSKFDELDKDHAVIKMISLMDDYADDPLVKDALLREYEFVTGEPFTKKSAAYRWAAEHGKRRP